MRYMFTILFIAAGLLLKAQDNCVPGYGFAIKKVKIDNKELAYVDEGKGKPVIMIHGLAGNASHWKRLIPFLSANYRCIAMDLPGYGSSAFIQLKEDQNQLDVFADVVLKFIKQLGLKNVTLAGHSMGGQISIMAALKDTKAIKKLILLAPAGLETFTEQEATLLKNYSKPEAFQMQDSATIRNNYKRNFYTLPGEANQLISDRMALKNCGHFAAWCQVVSNSVTGMLNHPVKDDLKKLKQKTLIVSAKNDELIPNKLLHPNLTIDDVTKVGTDNIKDAQLVMINEAGHMLHFEKPGEVADAIKDFLK
jgi:pimeloyl-ACP methyl ester carboxylesterase